MPQLSNREKILLAVLTVMALIGGFYYFIAKPQLAKLSAIEDKKAKYQLKVAELTSQISPKNPIYADHKVYENMVKDRTVSYFPMITQEKIITILEKLFQDSEFQPTAINYTSMKGSLPQFTEATINQETDLLKELSNSFSNYKPLQLNMEAQNAAQQKMLVQATGSIDRLGVTLSFSSSYESLSLFIKQLEAYKRRIVIDKINCSRNDLDQLNGTMDISFYAIPKLFEQDSDYTEWNYNNKYGKYNPFLPFGGYLDPNKASSSSVNQSESASFFVSLKPVTADVPSVMIGRKGGKAQSTYLYADNDNNEDIEFQFIEVNGKYYYRYKTERSSYPSDYKGMVEFKPGSNGIGIEIVSSRRQIDSDACGANIIIVNKTKLKVYANVMFDDKDNPRANFVNTSGNVVVTSTMEE